MPSLIEPYGGKLIDLRVAAEAREELTACAQRLPSLHLRRRSVCDLELLAVGAFSPLDRFMGSEDHQRVLDDMQLASGHLFPIPVTLPVDAGIQLALDTDVALRDTHGNLLAILTVEEIYPWSKAEVAQKVFGTQDLRHPLVAEMEQWGTRFVSGPLRVLGLPRTYDHPELRRTPAEVRARLEQMGHAHVVAFQTRNPLHRAHEELTQRAIRQVDGVLLLHPAVGMTKPGDVDAHRRVRTYQVLAQKYYAPDRILLSLLPLAMRLAGPREALWHALIRRNYGANHFIVGRDHASPGLDSLGRPFYGPYEAQEMAARHAAEIGVGILCFDEFVYLPDEDRYEERAQVPPHAKVAELSGTEMREGFLRSGRKLPSWIARPEVAEILAEAQTPRHMQGVCVWLTGLSGAGKSSTAVALTEQLIANGRRVTLLDGDDVRTLLSSGLGFSKEDRDTNIRRIGFVAAEIVRHGGVAVCAAVSPYRAAREDVRHMVGPEHFVEVYVNTPLEICEQRDTKGMYARARRGEIAHFTGIDDPYEPPMNPDVTLETTASTPEANAAAVLCSLIRKGFVQESPAAPGEPEQSGPQRMADRIEVVR